MRSTDSLTVKFLSHKTSLIRQRPRAVPILCWFKRLAQRSGVEHFFLGGPCVRRTVRSEIRS